jgi:hypothetical protein
VTPACAVVGVTRVRAGDGREAELAVVGVTPCTGAVAGGELGVAPAAEVVGVALDEAAVTVDRAGKVVEGLFVAVEGPGASVVVGATLGPPA